MDYILAVINQISDWLHARDYEKAKQAAAVDVVKRYARGNVSVQNGCFLNEDRLRRSSVEADEAMSRLGERFSRK